MVIVDVPRLVLYVLLVVLAVLGQVAWWMPVAVVLYDLHYLFGFVLPWMRKKLAKQQEVQRQHYLDAVMGRLVAEVRKDN